MQTYFFPFAGQLLKGRILSRYKRFLADIELENGQKVVAHVANSGSMATCWQPGAEVVLTWHGEGAPRKLKYSLQAVNMPDGWVGVNTMNPNRAVAEAMCAGAIEFSNAYRFLQTEVRVASGSRFDLVLLNNEKPQAELPGLRPARWRSLEGCIEKKHAPEEPAIVEIKNATMLRQDGVIFPDAVTLRGQKHLRHLIELKNAGFRSILVFFAGRSSANWVGIAEQIDSEYAKMLKKAIDSGVEVKAIRVEVSAHGLRLTGELPVCF
ncbi:MAG: DNA/RNA nuclease SfsA [Erysipelotrichia bacterium]|nr:DNA/RNA nuclease SfsA [Erysipelotrichia bacterium]